MKTLIKFTQLCLILIVLTACKTLEKKETPVKNLEEQESKELNNEKSKMEIRVSCEEGDISELLNEGWIIVEEYSEEKICTWKSFPATKDCDMEKDKGCKITTPDKIGEEKIYLLEK